MALTATEALRIQAIENKLNDLQTALNNVASKKQMKALTQIRQAEIEDLKQRVTTLESEIAVLQAAT